MEIVQVSMFFLYFKKTMGLNQYEAYLYYLFEAKGPKMVLVLHLHLEKSLSFMPPRLKKIIFKKSSILFQS